MIWIVWGFAAAADFFLLKFVYRTYRMSLVYRNTLSVGAYIFAYIFFPCTKCTMQLRGMDQDRATGKKGAQSNFFKMRIIDFVLGLILLTSNDLKTILFNVNENTVG